jgi:hypothetical protein
LIGVHGRTELDLPVRIESVPQRSTTGVAATIRHRRGEPQLAGVQLTQLS